jgi:hypothetical protein
MTDYQRALEAMDALRSATWFLNYLEERFAAVRNEGKQEAYAEMREFLPASEFCPHGIPFPICCSRP